MSMLKPPKMPTTTPASTAPTSPTAAGAPTASGAPGSLNQGQALGSAFSGFSFAPRLSAFVSNRSGRRSLIGGGS